MTQLLGSFSSAVVLLNEASFLPAVGKNTKQNTCSFIVTFIVHSCSQWGTWDMHHVRRRKSFIFRKNIVKNIVTYPRSLTAFPR